MIFFLHHLKFRSRHVQYCFLVLSFQNLIHNFKSCLIGVIGNCLLGIPVSPDVVSCKPYSWYKL